MKLTIIINDKPEEVEFINDYGDGLSGTLFLVGHEFGFTHLVNAQNMQDAEEAFLDQATTVPEGDEYQAYGFAGPDAFDAAREAAGDEGLNLADGYRHQANFTGTGIVNVGHYHGIQRVTVKQVVLDFNLGRP